MNCSPFDLRDYCLKELPDPERKQVEAHIRTCAECRQEVDRWLLTEGALASLREEEIPQRIAFVSDKIFEPAGWKRAWGALWGSSARLGFVSAAMISAALVVFAFSFSQYAGRKAAPYAPAAPAGLTAQQVQVQIDAAVEKALAANEAKFEHRIAEIQERDLKERQRLVQWADDLVDYSQRSELAYRRASYGAPEERGGGR
jgi:anti-sigma factor RsiW